MNLKYNGINSRGDAEWIELDLGKVMEEWQMIRYRSFVESLQENIGRQLTKNELQTILWLSGFEQSSINDIVSIVNAAYENGKVQNNAHSLN
ncbi:hypothetical protein [Bacillus cereus group sp. MYBK242-2]|uniref:hypothetical protein n=1 Tax=Bacillus cereus group sp. MYBK242-2 TaxID=3450647 RepID=UPI003F7B1C01